MEQSELITELAKEAKISEEEANKIIEAFIGTIKEGLARGEKVAISGFGTFTLSRRKAYDFLNPKTQQVHNIPEKNIPFFKAGRNFRDITRR
jgi:DNA-binding protein HU-beta